MSLLAHRFSLPLRTLLRCFPLVVVVSACLHLLLAASVHDMRQVVLQVCLSSSERETASERSKAASSEVSLQVTSVAGREEQQHDEGRGRGEGAYVYQRPPSC